MSQIWTNPSLQRNVLIQEVFNAEVVKSLKLSKRKIDTDELELFIVEIGKEYTFKFFNSDTGAVNIVSGMVESVYEDKIKVTYFENNDINCCDKLDVRKYNTITVFISVPNLLSIDEYKRDNPPCYPVENESDKKGIYVMLLGISATILKAIIVRLALFDDNSSEAVRYVDLEAGKVYDITYESNNTIYETRAKVVIIEEVEDEATNHSVEYVRENVGMDNNIYYNTCNCPSITMDDHMLNPAVRPVKITVDTSEGMEGRYETIMLHNIRNCIAVETI